MKRIFLVLLLLLFMVQVSSAQAYSATGYSQFMQIDFKDEGELLVNTSKQDINNAYKSMGRRRFWGWKIHYMNILQDADFIGEQIFSRSNRTQTPFIYDYQLKEVQYRERTFGTSGTISSKLKLKKLLEFNLDKSVKVDSSKKDSVTITEDVKMKLNIMPGTKLTLQTAGTAKVTNGVGRYYVLGLVMKKGTWETIDVTSIFYELIEENIE